MIDDPVLKMKVDDFIPIVGGARLERGLCAQGHRARRLHQARPTSHARKNIFAGGYSRATSHDTRLRLVLEIMDLPYTMVTGFPGTAQLNKAMLQNEVNFTGSSLPGFTTQVIPQIINPGVGIVAVPPSGDGAGRQAGRQSGARQAGHGDLRQVLPAGASASRRRARSGRRCS